MKSAWHNLHMTSVIGWRHQSTRNKITLVTLASLIFEKPNPLLCYPKRNHWKRCRLDAL